MWWGREPVAIAAAIRAVILAFVAFGLDWTAAQIASVMFAVEAILALVTRQSVTPNANVLLERNNGRVTPPAALIALCALGIGGYIAACGPQIPPGTAPETVTAHYATAVVDGITQLQTAVNDSYAAREISTAVADKIMDPAGKATAAAKRLSVALAIYHQAVTEDARAAARGDITAILADVERFAAEVIGAPFPPGTSSRIFGLHQKVLQAVTDVRSFIGVLRGGAPPAPAAVER